MGFLEPVQIPALNAAGIALTFAGAAHVHLVASREDVDFDEVAHIVGIRVFQMCIRDRAWTMPAWSPILRAFTCLLLSLIHI